MWGKIIRIYKFNVQVIIQFILHFFSKLTKQNIHARTNIISDIIMFHQYCICKTTYFRYNTNIKSCIRWNHLFIIYILLYQYHPWKIPISLLKIMICWQQFFDTRQNLFKNWQIKFTLGKIFFVYENIYFMRDKIYFICDNFYFI